MVGIDRASCSGAAGTIHWANFLTHVDLLDVWLDQPDPRRQTKAVDLSQIAPRQPERHEA
jgi:hypothetical protein